MTFACDNGVTLRIEEKKKETASTVNKDENFISSKILDFIFLSQNLRKNTKTQSFLYYIRMRNNNNIYTAFSMSKFVFVFFRYLKILIEQKATESSQIDWMSNCFYFYFKTHRKQNIHVFHCETKCEPTLASVFLLFN